MTIRPKLRDGFWLVGFVAITAAWFVDHKRMADDAANQQATAQHANSLPMKAERRA